MKSSIRKYFPFGPKPDSLLINSINCGITGLNSSTNESIIEALNNRIEDKISNNESHSEDSSEIDSIVSKEEEEKNDYNEDFDANNVDIREEIREKYFDHKSDKCYAEGVVTRIIGDSLIEIDGKTQIQYNLCYITDLIVNDFVFVEKNDNQLVVKPLRYKILLAKISDFDRQTNRFKFGKNAFIRKTRTTNQLKIGDVLKCVVIENQNPLSFWRAFPLNSVVDDIHLNAIKLMDNKNGIEIADDITFGDLKVNTTDTHFVLIANISERPQTLLSVDNEMTTNQIRFHAFHRSDDWDSTFVSSPFIIDAHSYAYVELICETEHLGLNKELVTFKFVGFEIQRIISVNVRDGTNQFGDQFKCDPKQYERRVFDSETAFVSGERLWATDKHISSKIEKFNVPNILWQILDDNCLENLPKVFPQLKEELNEVNYRKRFHILLHLEECANTFNVRKFDMSGVSLRREGQFIVIKIPGLADGRPSLIIGDSLKVFGEKKATENKLIGFEGFIHEIRRDEILVRFNASFHNQRSDGLFKVMFQFKRTVIRRSHHAIDLMAKMSKEVLFPTHIKMKEQLIEVPKESIIWFNESLNDQQKLAVIGALRGDCRPTPYMIFGPPGTGKTVTIVESILQVFKKLSGSRIIACTADNSSADLIAQKLLESNLVDDKDLIRVTAYHRFNSNLIPEALKSVAKIVDNKWKDWLNYRIIVTTTSHSGIIFTHEVSVDHFTHVFIDEAGQVTEPESLIPISLSAIGRGVIVLAGDHQQLGPVIQSMNAKAGGLNSSLMERLMNGFKPYQQNSKFSKYCKYNPRFVVKLVDNYRSDKLIMKIPSKLFYDNELRFKTETDHNLIRKLKLNSAVNFIGVNGEERKGSDTPSWYNSEEILKVGSLLERLYLVGVESKEIGVITPYREQVIRIRAHIKTLSLGPFTTDCRIGTIEEFQGLEKRVIIVSMVRSIEKYLSHDSKYNLGFVHNQKRFNVALSRAKSLLIVVGNPSLLSRDNVWNEFIYFCNENDSYYGCPFDDCISQKIVPLKSKI